MQQRWPPPARNSFPEYFPHSFGDPDFEPEMGEVSYDGYAPTPAIHPQDGLP